MVIGVNAFQLVRVARIPHRTDYRGGQVIMWEENAVAVERQHGEPVIVCEGPLAGVIEALKQVQPVRLSGIRVSLPDRHTAPFEFVGKPLRALIDDPNRPRRRALPLVPALVS